MGTVNVPAIAIENFACDQPIFLGIHPSTLFRDPSFKAAVWVPGRTRRSYMEKRRLEDRPVGKVPVSGWNRVEALWSLIVRAVGRAVSSAVWGELREILPPLLSRQHDKNLLTN